jgi:hypothetical protein
MLKISAFYLDTHKSFVPKKICTMDSSFFSQQMPYCLENLLVFMYGSDVGYYNRHKRLMFVRWCTQGFLSQVRARYSTLGWWTRAASHSDSNWLKLAENKVSQSVFTSFLSMGKLCYKQVSVDSHSFRFRLLLALHDIQNLSNCCGEHK